MFIEYLFLLRFWFLGDMNYRQIGTTKIICSKDVFDNCTTAIEELKTHSADLHQTLLNAKLVLVFHPDLAKNLGTTKCYFVGKDYTDLGVRGLLSFFVSMSYIVQAGLHHPFTAIDDGINGGIRRATATAQAAAWMSKYV